MDINSIIDRSFTEAMRGYKKEEVDEVLGDIAREFSQLKKENADLEKKLQVCADKIREYREDEDALKDALLGAQKAGKAIISDANEKAAAIIREAEDTAADRKQEIDDYVAEKNAEADRIIARAMSEKSRIEEEAKKAKDDIHTQMEIQTELDKEVLDRTKREAEDFRTRIIVEYQNHIEFIKKIPEQCFNEFVVNNAATHNSNNLRELIAAQQGVQNIAVPEIEEPVQPVVEEDRDSDVKVVESISGIEVSENESVEIEEIDETAAEIPAAQPEQEKKLIVEEEPEQEDEGSYGSFTVENAFGTDDDDEDDDEGGLELPDFLTTRPTRTANGGSKYDKLEFGSNNNDNNRNNHKKKRR